MVRLYQEDGVKEWFSADITIDGVTVPDVGVRLKGFSTLRTGSGPRFVIAKIGDAERRHILVDWCLSSHNEAASGVVADVDETVAMVP